MDANQHKEQLARDCKEILEQQAQDVVDLFTTLSDMCGGWFTTVQGFDKKDWCSDSMLVVTELAEGVEADRKNLRSDHCPEFSGREEELADVLVRCFHMADKYNLNLGNAFVAKMRYNFTRPIKHGKEY